jgi:hypothetical protein
MKLKQFSVINPFLRYKRYATGYLIGDRGGKLPDGNSRPINLTGITLDEFNEFVDTVEKIDTYYAGYADAHIRIYPSNDIVAKVGWSLLHYNWSPNAKGYAEKKKYISFKLQQVEGSTNAWANKLANYIRLVVAGGHIVQLGTTLDKKVDESFYGVQVRGTQYKFSTKQYFNQEKAKNEAEEATNTDTDGDGYIGDPSKGNKVNSSGTGTELSFTRIIIAIIIIIAFALFIKKRKK